MLRLRLNFLAVLQVDLSQTLSVTPCSHSSGGGSFRLDTVPRKTPEEKLFDSTQSSTFHLEIHPGHGAETTLDRKHLNVLERFNGGPQFVLTVCGKT